MLRAVLVAVAALACIGLAELAQSSAVQQDKKADTSKPKEETGKSPGKEPNKSKADKSSEPGKEPLRPKVPLDQMKLPANAIVVVVEDLLKASALIPKQWVLPFEEWLAMQERIKSLEMQLMGERALPSSCKLMGELKGDFLYFRAEYIFATGPNKTMVPLGLQGGHLIDEAQLNKQPAILEVDKDDGFLVRVDKEGNPHRLTLEFRVPVKKSVTGGLERSIDLGLPPATGTILDLKLPPSVKELRWNGASEKPLAPGRWLIGVERNKSLNLVWKEPPASKSPVAKVETHIKADVDATHVNITAELFLEDSGAKTEEWHLYLPATAKVESVKAPPGLTPILDDKAPGSILRVPPTSDRLQVTVSQRLLRPNPGTRVSIGPFNVLGAYQQNGKPQVFGVFQQTGTITVKMPPEASLGQRLHFTRVGNVTQTKNAETESAFQFVAPPMTDKSIKAAAALKALLELEWRFEKNQVRTTVDHLVKLKTTNQGWDIDVTTRIHASALFATIGALDLKLPAQQPTGIALIGTATPGMAFPGSLPWAGVWKTFGMPYSNSDEYTVADESGSAFKLIPQDATGKTRVQWVRSSDKDLTLVVKSSLRVPPQNRRVRLELPRPLGTQDRGGRLSIESDDGVELLHGPEGAEEPAPNRHHMDRTWDQAPGVVELAWRPHQREIISHAIIDIDVHEHSAQLRQTLRFPRDRSTSGADSKNPPISLRIPRGIEKVNVLDGGKIVNHDQARGILWVQAAGDAEDTIELKLQFDLPITNKALRVTPIWPSHGSQEDVKVRAWVPAGVQARLAADIIQLGAWKERSIELVRERVQFPSLVATAFGANLPLTITLEETAAPSLAAFVADRALIQVRTTDDGGQQCQARYWVRKINATFVDVELPLPLSLFRESPTFTIGKHPIDQWKKLDVGERLIRVQLHPDLVTLPAILEISYTLPADAAEQSSFWSTTLQAPVFRSGVVIGQMRWQLSTPAPLIAASFGRNVRAEIQWDLEGWFLTPEPANVDWEAWLNGRESAQQVAVATFSFAQVSAHPETVYHLPRQAWLLICSGFFLVLTLGTFFSPAPRWAFWLVLALLGVALASFAVVFPAAWPGVAFGLQPGILLLLVFITMHWLLQERYRRQLVFLPGFTRAKPGSTITRSNAAVRARESSTVDAPPGAMDGTASKPSGTPSGT